MMGFRLVLVLVVGMAIVDFFVAIKRFAEGKNRPAIAYLLLGFLFLIGIIVLIVTN